uniref:Uncharacterized protein n=1 Tax=Anopheles maculatus TaxID=74869 RepID=A0A182SIZ7_9DIPT
MQDQEALGIKQHLGQVLEVMADLQRLEIQEDKLVLEQHRSMEPDLVLMDDHWLRAIKEHNSVLEQEMPLEGQMVLVLPAIKELNLAQEQEDQLDLSVQVLEVMDAHSDPEIKEHSLAQEQQELEDLSVQVWEVMDAHWVPEIKEHNSVLEQEMLLEEQEALLAKGLATKGHSSDPMDDRLALVTKQAKVSLQLVEEQPLVTLEVKALHEILEDETDESTTLNADDSEQTTTFGGYGDVQSAAGLFTNGNRRLVQ